MGPQLGYYYPEIVMQGDLHGGGIDARGIIAPIAPYVFIGRGRDFAWSLTSADSENEQQFLEQLCNPDGSRPDAGLHALLLQGTLPSDDAVRRRPARSRRTASPRVS